MTGLFVSGLAGLVYCILMYRLARAWPVSGISPDSGSALPPVSVLIAAHNEADRLRRYLPSVLSQEYPVFEVIVALDRCTDES